MTEKPLILSDVQSVRKTCDAARKAGKRVALVPTMGALHRGHLSLVEEAQRRGDFSVVSIFVNPTQFGPGEDFDRYPRTFASDLEKLSSHGVDLLFAPERAGMYRSGFSSRVQVAGLTEGLCGASRPGHFDGVTTVVNKLFNIVGPCSAIFGRKDYQQLKTIEKMVRDLDMPVEVVGMPTFREPDGLALSSRNIHLGKAERERALSLVSGLRAAHRLYDQGQRNVGPLRRAAIEPVAGAADAVDYVTAADPDTLGALPDDSLVAGPLLIAIAVKIGATRLIDNTVLGEDRLI